MVCEASTRMMWNLQPIKIEGETTYAIQYHPEVFHSIDGSKMLWKLSYENSQKCLKIPHTKSFLLAKW
jgi:anthranilate/para-aminobenzoate synthase component II